MTQETRHQRLRNLVRQLNSQRKQQAKQIDILCNDLIDAQRDFIRRLGTISFAASFYKEILGKTEPHEVYRIAGQYTREVLPSTQVVFCRPDHTPWLYDTHALCDSVDDGVHLEQYFCAEVIAEISQANQVCDTDDMLALGLQVNPCVLTGLKAVAIPLTDACRNLGFILLYHAGHDFKRAELEQVGVVASGLARILSVAASCPQTSKGMDSLSAES